MTQPDPSHSPTPAERRAIRRHIASAAGAHLLCRRGACRRACACRQTDTCLSTYNGDPGGAPADQELMAFQFSYFLKLVDHWRRLPRRPPAGKGRPARGETRTSRGQRPRRLTPPSAARSTRSRDC
jgi:hypothetical protein